MKRFPGLRFDMLFDLATVNVDIAFVNVHDRDNLSFAKMNHVIFIALA